MNQTQEKIEKDLNNLAEARETLERVSQANQKLERLYREGAEIVSELEANIREAAIALYDESCDLPPRVAVKWFTTVKVFDELKAKEWCIDHFTPALKLDLKVFEKAAKDGNIPKELAEVGKETRAQIAAKL